MYTIDETDEQLIKLLEQDAWQTSEALASPLNVSSATIRRRLKRLVQNGILRAVAVHVDTTDTRVEAMVALNVTHGSLDSVIQALARHPEAKWVASTTGRFDVLTLFEFNSTEELFQYVRNTLILIDGIKDSETFVCLHVGKGKHILSIA
ncbi:MAG: Lrp/AsnC family transcriptional regulator [Dehalococcoidales bacterium]|nr:Lrp/AsnC family transcriptional regulator [Dehalococcoidales bacterium]